MGVLLFMHSDMNSIAFCYGTIMEHAQGRDIITQNSTEVEHSKGKKQAIPILGLLQCSEAKLPDLQIANN